MSKYQGRKLQTGQMDPSLRTYRNPTFYQESSTNINAGRDEIQLNETRKMMRFSPTNDPFDSDEDSLSVAYRYIDSLMVEDAEPPKKVVAPAVQSSLSTLEQNAPACPSDSGSPTNKKVECDVHELLNFYKEKHKVATINEASLRRQIDTMENENQELKDYLKKATASLKQKVGELESKDREIKRLGAYVRQEAAAKEALADLKRQMVHKDDWIQQLESKLDNFRKFRDLLIEEPNSVNRQLAIDHPNPTTAGNVAAGRVGGRARIDPLFVNNAINRVLNPNATTAGKGRGV